MSNLNSRQQPVKIKTKKLLQKLAKPKWRIYHGDMLEVLQRRHKLQQGLFDVVITDPPYNLASITKRFGKTNLRDNNKTAQRGRNRSDNYARLSRGFMNETWDNDIAFQVKTWQRVYKCMKPGAYLIAMGGTRTWHRLAVAIEDAGFIYRDTFMWMHGQGFPKSHDVSKAIDRVKGKQRNIIGQRQHPTLKDKTKIDRQGKQQFHGKNPIQDEWLITAPNDAMAKLYNGFGTAVKPAWEPILICQKPIEGTIAANVLKYGTGGINIDAGRIALTDNYTDKKDQKRLMKIQKNNQKFFGQGGIYKKTTNLKSKGRWPANVVHDGSPEVLQLFGLFGNRKAGAFVSSIDRPKQNMVYGKYNKVIPFGSYNDDGSVARFFYTAKPSKRERSFHCTICDRTFFHQRRLHHQHNKLTEKGKPDFSHINSHPTVKPLALMQHLVNLFTPPNGRVLDPFAGSGTTLQAVVDLGFRAVGIEQNARYVRHIHQRMLRAAK